MNPPRNPKAYRRWWARQREEYRQRWAENAPVPYGLCWCGCGEETLPTPENDKSRGWVRSEPRRYARNHHLRKAPTQYIVEDRGYDTPCWIWQWGKNSHGYGRMWVGSEQRLCLSHRVYYERYKGPIPDGLDLDHRCRVRACVNPDHMEPTTRAENIRRGAGTKLSAAQVEEIKRLDATTDLLQREIAERYGVDEATVGSILLGYTWRQGS